MAYQTEELLSILKIRFEENMHRHEGLSWDEIKEKLDTPLLDVVRALEESGGEPDVTLLDGELAYVDFVAESPAGRRNCCYDAEARLNRKKNAPETSALELCEQYGAELLAESDYRALQLVEAFDQKTSSWMLTPLDVRNLKGALFCDRRYGRVFTYHNGADSWYGSRGFRAKVKI